MYKYGYTYDLKKSCLYFAEKWSFQVFSFRVKVFSNISCTFAVKFCAIEQHFSNIYPRPQPDASSGKGVESYCG